MLHVSDEAVLDVDRLHIDAANMDLIGRMEGPNSSARATSSNREVSWGRPFWRNTNDDKTEQTYRQRMPRLQIFDA